MRSSSPCHFHSGQKKPRPLFPECNVGRRRGNEYLGHCYYFQDGDYHFWHLAMQKIPGSNPVFFNPLYETYDYSIAIKFERQLPRSEDYSYIEKCKNSMMVMS